MTYESNIEELFQNAWDLRREAKYDLALDNLLMAKELLPGSKKPVKLLAQTYKQLGDEENYQIHLKKYQQMKFFLH